MLIQRRRRHLSRRLWWNDHRLCYCICLTFIISLFLLQWVSCVTYAQAHRCDGCNIRGNACHRRRRHHAAIALPPVAAPCNHGCNRVAGGGGAAVAQASVSQPCARKLLTFFSSRFLASLGWRLLKQAESVVNNQARHLSSYLQRMRQSLCSHSVQLTVVLWVERTAMPT